MVVALRPLGLARPEEDPMWFKSPAIDAAASKATPIDLFSLSTVQMRAFHVTWKARICTVERLNRSMGVALDAAASMAGDLNHMGSSSGLASPRGRRATTMPPQVPQFGAPARDRCDQRVVSG